ncbi:histidine utilization repressor [Sodalis ligni]|jgi:GntR family histidine utilization transcriptional repressor|uniref:Histidine utilization repressor n=1 Tax=Sodalis ligni TaxID=2697027 RepID=A0A4R1N7C8_9GAMM|nr:histidine utilization repressor [Sodalis ligni]TCL03175.1 GntR family transcriptional regulator [Sodalis ligni]
MGEPTKIMQLTELMGVQPAPLYQRVKQAIISQISSGAWKPNQRIPSENKLVDELGVSRMTINRALRELASEGYLLRMQGVGTYVAELKVHTTIMEVHNISDEIAGRGHKHASKVIALGDVPADDTLATAFAIKPGESLFHSLIVHYENAIPIQLEERWVNPVMAPDYLLQDYEKQTPYIYLNQASPLTSGEHIIEAISPTAAQCKLLAIKKNDPCLLISRHTRHQRTLVTYTKLLYPGARHQLHGSFIRHG